MRDRTRRYGVHGVHYGVICESRQRQRARGVPDPMDSVASDGVWGCGFRRGAASRGETDVERHLGVGRGVQRSVVTVVFVFTPQRVKWAI